jgi:hypothetical protein
VGADFMLIPIPLPALAWPAWLIWVYGHEGSGPYQSIFLDHFEKLAERCAKSSYGEYLMSIHRTFAKSRSAEL